jgi:hypothetical protein
MDAMPFSEQSNTKCLKNMPILKYVRSQLAILLVSFFHAAAAMAQCAICRDATAGSAPAARAGLRLAIPVLGVPALVLFSTLLVLALRRDKQMRESERDRKSLKADGGT